MVLCLLWLACTSHPFVDTNDSAINGTGVDNIFEVIDEERYPSKADSNNEEENSCHDPRQSARLIVNLSGDL